MPNVIVNGIAILLASFAVFAIVTNYACIVASHLNRLRGIDRHHSMVFIVPQLFLLLSHAVSFLAPARLLPGWLLLAVALADVSLWMLMSLPIWLLFRRR